MVKVEDKTFNSQLGWFIALKHAGIWRVGLYLHSCIWPCAVRKETAKLLTGLSMGSVQGGLRDFPCLGVECTDA